MNIAIYARKSVYSDKSDSTEVQINIGRDYAQHYYPDASVTTYEDEGFTGANIKRPGFTRLMDDIKKKRVNILICYKIDRISRDVKDFSIIFGMLQDHHVEFVSVKEQIDTSTPLGRAMMYICSVFAQMERETIAERVRDNMLELAKSGKWAGGKAPLGYKRERIEVNGKIHTTLAPDDTELPLLYSIFSNFLDGRSLNSLETYFKKTGTKSMNGNFLSSTQLHQILKNPQYVAAAPEIYDYFKDLGCIMAVDRDKFNGINATMVYNRTTGSRSKVHTKNKSNKWVVTVGLHKPVIDTKMWLQVQRRFGENIIDKTRIHEIGILKGVLRCKCGYLMRTKKKVDKIYHKTYENYYCRNREVRGIEYCDLKTVAIDDLDQALIEKLRAIRADKNLLLKHMENAEADIRLRSKDLIVKDISVTEKKIKNLTEALKDSSGSGATKYIISEIDALDKQLVGLKYEMVETEDEEKRLATKKTDIDSVYEKICDYLDAFDTLSYEAKNSFLKNIIKSCVWDGSNLSVVF